MNTQHLSTKATIRAQEKERSEIGRELRENVNQMLACIKHYLHYSLAHDEDRIAAIQKSLETLDSCIGEINGLSRQLLPPSLRDLGLREAIRELLVPISSTGFIIKCTGLYAFEESSLSEELQLSIYRILQEQLNNISNHAMATEARISFSQAAGSLIMEIADNGRGFDMQTTSKGAGMINVYQRVAAFNGTVNLASAPGNGTTLRVNFHLNA